MREWSVMLLGAVIGAAAAIYYMNNESTVEQQARRVKARTRRVMERVQDHGCCGSEMLKR